MSLEVLSTLTVPAAIIVTVTAIWLLISHGWRTSLLALAMQYLGIFLLVVSSWPLQMAAVKLVAGWMSAAILGAAVAGTTSAWQRYERFWPSGRIFRFLLAMLMVLAVNAMIPAMESWLTGVDRSMIFGGAILIAMGLLHLGLTDQPLRVTVGLLTVIAGFEVLYAAVESSTLLAALLAVVNLGLALVGGYLLNVAEMERRA